jgi:hypothetical protein
VASVSTFLGCFFVVFTIQTSANRQGTLRATVTPTPSHQGLIASAGMTVWWAEKEVFHQGMGRADASGRTRSAFGCSARLGTVIGDF